MSAEFTRCYGCFKERAGSGACPHCGWRPAKASPLVLSPGTVLHGRYVVGRVLGKPGGFGITYLGWHADLETRVAIKEFLPRDLAGRESGGPSVVCHSEGDSELFGFGLERFLNEARTLARLRHPNVVQVADYFEAHGTAYLVMDYYEGRTLAERVEKEGVFEVQEAITVMDEVLEGLEQVHAQGFLHRDIKPQNIYLTWSGQPILLDFGAARQALGERSASLSVILTEGFAPLEQYYRRGGQGAWTDIYACAATLYFMISGDVPPDAPERVEGDDFVPLARRARAVPPHVSDAVTRGLAVRPSDRPQRVAEWRGMLVGRAPADVPPPRAVMTPVQPRPIGTPATAPGPTPAPKPRPLARPWAWKALAALVLVALLGAGMIAVEDWRFDRAMEAGELLAAAGDHEAALLRFRKAAEIRSGYEAVDRRVREAEARWAEQERSRSAYVSAGPDHSCIIDERGSAYCWGRGPALGISRWVVRPDGQPVSRICMQMPDFGPVVEEPCTKTPARVEGIYERLRSIATGPEHGCALDATGRAYCWGRNGHGQLGNGGTEDSDSPKPVSGDAAYTALAVGRYHSCGVTKDGVIHCWGGPGRAIGLEADEGRPTPAPIAAPVAFKALAAGADHTCALGTQGTAYCWGDNSAGQLGAGRGAPAASATPLPVAGERTFVLLAAGRSHTCGLSPAGQSFCWGGNATGQLGADGIGDSSPEPVLTMGTRTAPNAQLARFFKTLSAGDYHTCGLTEAGEAYCWGGGEYWPFLGSSPTRVADGVPLASIAGGVDHACGIATDGRVLCWGLNDGGELGDGTTNRHNTPVAVAGLKAKVVGVPWAER